MHEDRFGREYRMPYAGFCTLVMLLDPLLERREECSNGSEQIQVEHICGLGLRVLAGGTVSDNRHLFGMSRAAAYVALNDFLTAVNSCPELSIFLPSTQDDWRSCNLGFRARSSNDVMTGAVLAVDGFFQRTQMPTRAEVANQLAYYSGHYESYGVNCQAAVQADLQFRYFGVHGPGNTNDLITYPRAVELHNAITSLPVGLYAVCDAAYPLTERTLTPFTGNARRNK